MGLAGAGPGGASVGGSAEIREARLGLYGLRGWAKRLVAGRSLGMRQAADMGSQSW